MLNFAHMWMGSYTISTATCCTCLFTVTVFIAVDDAATTDGASAGNCWPPSTVRLSCVSLEMWNFAYMWHNNHCNSR